MRQRLAKIYIYVYRFEPDLHQSILVVRVSTEVMCNTIDCVYIHMYTLKYMCEYE